MNTRITMVSKALVEIIKRPNKILSKPPPEGEIRDDVTR
jgi:hypothetical protein